MVRDYVLVWRSDIDPGNIKLVGPFQNEAYAAIWGKIWQQAHQDNPCWNTITLEEDLFATISNRHNLLLPVLTPGTPEANS